MPNIVVHHLEKSRSHRILWLLEELGLEYELKVYPRGAGMRAPAELRKLHPLGKAPVVTVDGVTLAESGAVIEQLVEEHGEYLRPAAGSEARRHYRYWLHYAEGSLMAPLLVRLIIDRVRTAPLPFFIKPIAKAIAGKVDGTFTNGEVERHSAFVEQWLSEHPWFAGETFSAADIQMSYPVMALVERGRPPAPMPKTKAWLATIRARPAYVTAEERGGDNGLA